MTLGESFDRAEVMDLAGPGAYARGVGYHNDGRVELGPVGEDRVKAVVRGTIPYRVALWADATEAGWECECPAADDGSFCKHCVAVAVAISADERWSPIGLIDRDPVEPTDREVDLVEYVAGLGPDRLVELVMEQAYVDRRLRERLLAEAQAAAGSGPSTEVWRRRVDQVFAPSGTFVSYREAPAWAADVDELIDGLFDLCRAGHSEAAMSLAVHAHHRADDAIDHVDDSDGWLTGISSRLGQLHLQACIAAKPDPGVLAAELVDLELTLELGAFHRSASVYATVLGEEGLQEYRRLAELAWSELSGRRDQDGRGDGREFRARNAMVGWAMGTGDPDQLIAVKGSDLRLPEDYFEIATMLEGAGRIEDAIEWARRGLAGHADRTWQLEPLRDLLSRLLRSTGDTDRAVELYWEAFIGAPSVSAYRRLVGEAPSARAMWLDRSVDELRDRLEGGLTGMNLRSIRPSDALVGILLFEGRVDEAWEAADKYGCERRNMMTLARTREESHPLDTVGVYEEEVFELIDTKNNSGYRAAVDLMKRIESLAERADAPDRFDALLQRVRTEHRAKRNLRAMLDSNGWPDTR